MTANSVLAYLFSGRPSIGQKAAAVLESEQPIRLSPTLTADELPVGFEEILEVQVLGYRERLTTVHGGRRQRVLDPVWTLIPKFEAA
ncbi:MAG: hypothetical protein QOG78_3260 [Rhodospirillaceae bacterium]|jgi:hypothetical protein|nr:hypothetical protein [Rhodospirillaceae bacterium]MEA2847979.1 hypothetical protein [Rhodospirillaceae bacterium]